MGSARLVFGGELSKLESDDEGMDSVGVYVGEGNEDGTGLVVLRSSLLIRDEELCGEDVGSWRRSL